MFALTTSLAQTGIDDLMSSECVFPFQDGASFTKKRKRCRSVADEGSLFFEALVLQELEDVVFQVPSPRQIPTAVQKNVTVCVRGCNGETCLLVCSLTETEADEEDAGVPPGRLLQAG